MIPPKRAAPFRHFGSHKHKGPSVKGSNHIFSIMITILTMLIVLAGIIFIGAR